LTAAALKMLVIAVAPGSKIFKIEQHEFGIDIFPLLPEVLSIAY
jgi:hypothetical protein